MHQAHSSLKTNKKCVFGRISHYQYRHVHVLVHTLPHLHDPTHKLAITHNDMHSKHTCMYQSYNHSWIQNFIKNWHSVPCKVQIAENNKYINLILSNMVKNGHIIKHVGALRGNVLIKPWKCQQYVNIEYIQQVCLMFMLNQSSQTQ